MSDAYPPEADVSAESELANFLNHNGVQYNLVRGEYRVVMLSDTHKWRTIFKTCEQTVLIYGIYPFPAAESRELYKAICEVNSRLLHGAMFICGGSVVMRTDAELTDAYGAYEAIASAAEYNADALTSFWMRVLNAVSLGRKSAENREPFD